MHSYRVFNVSGKFIRGEFSKTKVLSYKRSWMTLSVTSRREISRHDVKKITPLPRRDLRISRRDVILILLCHVATWIFTSRPPIFIPLPRRDVDSHVATLNCKAPCHVATWNSHVATWTSHIATSLLHVATSFGHLLCHVAT